MLLVIGAAAGVNGQTSVAIDASPSGRQQTIDGFGTCISGNEGTQSWWQQVFLDDLGASILRIDLVPRFKSPWSDLNYYSPWFMGGGNQPYAFNYEITSSHTPRYYTGQPADEFITVGGTTYYNGPEGNRARTYTDAASYGRLFGNRNAPIAVMGPSIDDNIARCFDTSAGPAPTALAIIEAARVRDPSLARFKLTGSIWSPMPWVKVASGSVVGAQYGFWPFAPQGTAFPFVSGGNFVGGRLDDSETPVAAFDDSALPADTGGPNAGASRGATSALVQFARATAAYARAVQNHTGMRFHSISIQNELNFETFYNSCTYRLSSQYIKALRYVRAEFDKYDDLRGIQIMGPEDLLSDSTYSLWQYGGSATAVHKNLQYLQNIAADPQALQDVGFFCIHGYAPDGVSAAGSDPVAWQRWADGWTTSPASGLPANVTGFAGYGKKSWMSETSGEAAAWLAPASGYPGNGGFSIAVKIHQALTAGRQSAWIYWQMTDGASVREGTLTDATLRANSPKLTAMRHFARYVRPGAVRLQTTSGSATVLASAYHHEADKQLTIVLVNSAATAASANVTIPASLATYTQLSAVTSSSGSLWQASTPAAVSGSVAMAIPAYGVVTLVASAPPGAPAAPDTPASSLGGDGLSLSWPAVAGATSYVVERAYGAGGAFEVAADGLSNPGFVVRAFLAGTTHRFRVRAVGAGGTSDPSGVVSFDPPAATPVANRLSNLSTRGFVGTGENILIPGFVFASDVPKQFLIRGLGPALQRFLSGFIADPKISLYRQGSGAVVEENDNWSSAANAAEIASVGASLGAITLASGSLDAAMLVTLDPWPSGYTIHVAGADGGTGIALAEVYEVDGTQAARRLRNISTRGFATTGSGVMIPGFVVTGTAPATLLLRAVGPELARFGIADPLADPVLGLHQQSDGRLLIANDDWSNMANASLVPAAVASTRAFNLASGSKDSTLLVVVFPGTYTAIASGAGGTSGLSLVEVYEVGSVP
jgi:O-glycosyl hydrolase